MFCKKCGKEIPDGAKFCPYCGADQNYKEVYTRKKVDYNASKYSRTLALIFACIGFVAIGGIHRFYVGKIGTGVIWFLLEVSSDLELLSMSSVLRVELSQMRMAKLLPTGTGIKFSHTSDTL